MTMVWIMTSIIIFCAAALQSLTGFGFAIMAIPLLSIFMDPHQAIPLVMLISFCTISMNIRTVSHYIDRQLLKRLLLGSLLGLPLGGFVFYYLDIHKLKLFVSLCIVATTVIMVGQNWLCKWLPNIKEKAWLFGTVSGFLTLSVGMPGPPIVLYLIASGENKDRFRAISLAFLFLIYPITLSVFAVSKTISVQWLWSILFLLPFSWLGIQLGNRINPYLNAKVFRILTFILIFSTGIYSLIQSL